MKLNELTSYNILVCIVSTILLLSIVVFTIMVIKRFKQKQKKFYFKIAICSIFIFLATLLVQLYFRPVYLKFQMPINQISSISIYTAKRNSSGGIDQEKDDITYEEYSQVINILKKALLSPRIIDKNIANDSDKGYILILTFIQEHDGVYLREVNIYIDKKGKFKSYVTAIVNGKKRTYQIIDKKIIVELVELYQQFLK